MRHPFGQGLQRRRQLRLRLLPDEPEARPALERDGRFPEASPASPEFDCSYERFGFEARFSWERLRRPSICSRTKDLSSKSEAGNDSRGGRQKIAAAPPAVRNRAHEYSRQAPN